nr:unnamed protein product [Callosobruchus chinensis]
MADKVTYLIDIATPNDKNIQNTYAGKISKYTDLAIEVKRLWKQNKVIIVPFNMSVSGLTPFTFTPHIQQLGLDEKLHKISQKSDQIWHEYVSPIATAAGKKLGYLFRQRKYFSPSNLLTLYKAQIRPSLEYCSHIWGAAAPTTLSILDAVQRRAIRLIGDPALTCHLQPLSQSACCW